MACNPQLRNNALHNTGLFVLLFWQAVTGNAQTNISGFINANTTWSLSGSPYIVTGNALVSYGYILTIEPGVVVKFNTDKALQIDGELHAVGTAESRITFTSNQPNPSAGDWAKIHFADTCIDASYDALGNYISGSIMKYCDVLYGGGLGYGEIHAFGSSPYFSNCRILHSSSGGISLNKCNNVIDSCVIRHCVGYGLNWEYADLNLNNILITNDSIENNGGGIAFGNMPGAGIYYIQITNCFFMAHSTFSVLQFSNPTTPNTIIEGNVFQSNSKGVVSINGMINNYIRCNKFTNNSGKIIHNNANNYSGDISYNLFAGNTITNGSVIDLECNSSTDTTSITHNVFYGNTASDNCIKLEPNINDMAFTQIRNNEFKNNVADNTILLDPFYTPNGDFNFIEMKYNTFSNPLTQYEIRNNLPFGSGNVYVDSNYWGGVNTQHIDSVIYDYFDYANQSVVYYQPILYKSLEIDTSCIPLSLPTSITVIKEPEFKSIIYPNPATNYFTIAFDYLLTKGDIEIFNMLGERVLQKDISQSSKLEVDATELSNGIYLVKIRNGGNSHIHKVILQR